MDRQEKAHWKCVGENQECVNHPPTLFHCGSHNNILTCITLMQGKKQVSISWCTCSLRPILNQYQLLLKQQPSQQLKRCIEMYVA